MTFAEVAPVMDVIASGGAELILVGGQAVNFWAEFYAPRVPELRLEAPFTSGDIDLVGRGAEEEAVRIARALQGTVRKPTIYERTAALAEVAYRDAAGDERVIDFMRRLWRVDVADVERTSLVMRPGLRVMHPVWCLESRVHNVLDLAEYQTDDGRKQARAAIVCAREFLRDALDGGQTKAVLRLNERIFKLAHERGRKCAAHALRPFDAVLVDPRLPEAFKMLQYPRMQRAVADAMARGAPARGM